MPQHWSSLGFLARIASPMRLSAYIGYIHVPVQQIVQIIAFTTDETPSMMMMMMMMIMMMRIVLLLFLISVNVTLQA